MKNSTLSHKLFIRIIPTIVFTILLIAGFAFHSADVEINTVYDAQLISNANVLWTLVGDELDEASVKGPKRIDDIDLQEGNQILFNASADDYAEARMFRVWKADRMLVYSDTALPQEVVKRPTGFSDVTYKGEDWRVYNLPLPGDQVSIEVGEKLALRNTLVDNILFNLAWPLLLLVPVIGVMIWFGIGSGLGTIHNLVEQIRKRSPNDLSHVDTNALPKDLAPLGKSLNQLFTQLDHSFTTEKRFTDHAAHQLRTPHATIKLQLQMLAKATTDEEKQGLITELMMSNERASKLVGMLLTSARLHHQQINMKSVVVYQSIAAVMAELGLLAKEKSIDMSLQGDEQLATLADETLLKLMLGNLIENAIKYTPIGGSVGVRVARQENDCKIYITDTGCGIPEEARALVFERFYRVGTPEPEGSGLGLAIVADIIERFSGSIALKTPGNGIGLLVEITLPAQ